MESSGIKWLAGILVTVFLAAIVAIATRQDMQDQAINGRLIDLHITVADEARRLSARDAQQALEILELKARIDTLEAQISTRRGLWPINPPRQPPEAGKDSYD